MQFAGELHRSSAAESAAQDDKIIRRVQESRDRRSNPRSDIMPQSANTNRGLTRTIFRWIHLVFSIPILGYIYSPFDKLPAYAFKTRYIFVPTMILSGLWMWKGHVVRRLLSKRPASPTDSYAKV